HHPPTTAIYTLSLHDALPISGPPGAPSLPARSPGASPRATASLARPPAERVHLTRDSGRTRGPATDPAPCPQRSPAGRLGQSRRDRKSTRLNSSHDQISYAVF